MAQLERVYSPCLSLSVRRKQRSPNTPPSTRSVEPVRTGYRVQFLAWEWRTQVPSKVTRTGTTGLRSQPTRSTMLLPLVCGEVRFWLTVRHHPVTQNHSSLNSPDFHFPYDENKKNTVEIARNNSSYVKKSVKEQPHEGSSFAFRGPLRADGFRYRERASVLFLFYSVCFLGFWWCGVVVCSVGLFVWCGVGVI